MSAPYRSLEIEIRLSQNRTKRLVPPEKVLRDIKITYVLVW